MLLALQLNNLLGDAPTLVPVPDVVGDTQAAGTIELEGDLFVVVVATAYSSIVAAGLIISQSPAAGVDAIEGSTVTITVSLGEAPASNSGGWSLYLHFEEQRHKRDRKRREQEEAEEALQSKIEREIAELLHTQERKDDQQKELERIKSLVTRYADSIDVSSQKVNQAIQEAKAKQTRASLEKLQREFYRMMEEEEMAALLTLAMID